MKPNYFLGLPSRPFYAIKNGTKKAEGRVTTEPDEKYHIMKPGETILFTNEDNGEEMLTRINYVNHYEDPREMLIAEGIENMLSSGSDLEQGVKIYNSFENYEKNIPIHGIYAIGITAIK